MGGSEPSRREFVRRSAGLLSAGALTGAGRCALAGLAASAAASCRPSPDRAKPPLFEATVDVASLAADGEALVTPTPGFDGAPILVIRSSARRFVALSMLCTHEGCPVRPPVAGVISCPCHGSQYDLEGKVRRGPAQFALARYETRLDAGARRLTVMMEE